MSDDTKNVIMESKSIHDMIHDTLRSILWTLRLGFLAIIIKIAYIYNGGDLFSSASSNQGVEPSTEHFSLNNP
jgi:hypothetical protein